MIFFLFFRKLGYLHFCQEALQKKSKAEVRWSFIFTSLNHVEIFFLYKKSRGPKLAILIKNFAFYRQSVEELDTFYYLCCFLLTVHKYYWESKDFFFGVKILMRGTFWRWKFWTFTLTICKQESIHKKIIFTWKRSFSHILFYICIELLVQSNISIL